MGRLIGERPDALSNTLVLEDAVPDVADTEDHRDDGGSRNRSSESTVTHFEAPPSASQMYHAALADNSTLDDVLAAFEADDGAPGIVVDRIVICGKPRAHLPAERLDTMDQQKRLRYCNPSVHSAEGEESHSAQLHGATPGSDAQLSPQPRTLEPESPAAEATATAVRTQADCNDDLQRLEDSSVSDLACEHEILEVQSGERHLGLHALNPCPNIRPAAHTKSPASTVCERRQATFRRFETARCNVKPRTPLVNADEGTCQTATKSGTETKPSEAWIADL